MIVVFVGEGVSFHSFIPVDLKGFIYFCLATSV